VLRLPSARAYSAVALCHTIVIKTISVSRCVHITSQTLDSLVLSCACIVQDVGGLFARECASDPRQLLPYHIFFTFGTLEDGNVRLRNVQSAPARPARNDEDAAGASLKSPQDVVPLRV